MIFKKIVQNLIVNVHKKKRNSFYKKKENVLTVKISIIWLVGPWKWIPMMMVISLMQMILMKKKNNYLISSLITVILTKMENLVEKNYVNVLQNISMTNKKVNALNLNANVKEKKKVKKEIKIKKISYKVKVKSVLNAKTSKNL